MEATMSYPGFSVETSALLEEAQLWERLSLTVERIGQNALELKIVGNEVGVFTSYVPGYHVLIDAINARCQDGRDKMAEIRNTIAYIAQLYERTEANHTDEIKQKAQ